MSLDDAQLIRVTLIYPIYEPPAKNRRKAAWAQLLQRMYKVDPLECVNFGSNIQFIALIDDVDVVDRGGLTFSANRKANITGEHKRIARSVC